MYNSFDDRRIGQCVRIFSRTRLATGGGYLWIYGLRRSNGKRAWYWDEGGWDIIGDSQMYIPQR